MRLGTFNVENLFDRAAAMNLPTWVEGKPILEDFKRLNDLIAKETYTNVNKQEMHTVMRRHKGLLTQDESKFIRLRVIRGKFKKKLLNGPVEIVANGRAAAILLESRIGDRFDAIVTGASEKGTWVRLLQPPVEGKLIHGVEGTDVGHRIRVQLVHTDVDRGYIDFKRIE